MFFHGFTGFIIDKALDLLSLLIIAYALLSWFPKVDRRNPIVQFINKTGDTLCEPIRKLIPPRNMGNIDISPIIVILIINFLRMIL